MKHCKDNEAIPKVAFAYDALGRRVDKVDAMAGTTTRYTYDSHPSLDCEGAAKMSRIISKPFASANQWEAYRENRARNGFFLTLR
ncbi:MAG: RHS repeat protein [Phycisphaerae bacterium]|nr:RHS repeat protein [Phycisphaerae bacterium]